MDGSQPQERGIAAQLGSTCKGEPFPKTQYCYYYCYSYCTVVLLLLPPFRVLDPVDLVVK